MVQVGATLRMVTVLELDVPELASPSLAYTRQYQESPTRMLLPGMLATRVLTVRGTLLAVADENQVPFLYQST